MSGIAFPGLSSYNVSRGKFPPGQLRYVPRMGHFRDMAFRDRYALRDYLTCPYRAYSIKGSGVGKAPYTVKE